MRTIGFAAAFLALSMGSAGAAPIPQCRLDDTYKAVVRGTLERAIAAYRTLGKDLPIGRIEVNSQTPSDDLKTLSVFIVHDAARTDVKPDGCASRPPARTDPLDGISVRGACVVLSGARMEMRCSSAAVRIFGAFRAGENRENPALLYVLAHELAHVLQGRVGAYSGTEGRITLKDKQAAKLQVLRNGCDPVSTRLEEEADALSLRVMSALLGAAPYRETFFSERGSMYWNIDLMAVATDAWQNESLERDAVSAPKLHATFEPTDLPTPPQKIEAAARRFVCDVLTKSQGTVTYPGPAGTHPPLVQRLRRIAEALKPVADGLPATGGSKEFQPIVRLQNDLSQIFTHIYRETGVYREAVQNLICTRVNAPNPQHACR